MTHVLLIDNYDSFTYNIKYYFESLGSPVTLYLNDKISLCDIQKLNPTHIVLSPGPGNPNDAGITLDIIKYCYDRYPILGICLGHQCIAASFGARIVRALEVCHGKISTLQNNGKGVFQGLPEQFAVTRYHSLIVQPDTLSNEFTVSAWIHQQKDPASNKLIMGIQHKIYPLFGIQYHPEAVLSEYGYALFRNFLGYAIKFQETQEH